jgi:hypothetical protein
VPYGTAGNRASLHQALALDFPRRSIAQRPIDHHTNTLRESSWNTLCNRIVVGAPAPGYFPPRGSAYQGDEL